MHNKSPAKGKQKGLTAHELTQRHLKDENHVTTDEEMENVKVGIEVNEKKVEDNKATEGS